MLRVLGEKLEQLVSNNLEYHEPTNDSMLRVLGEKLELFVLILKTMNLK